MRQVGTLENESDAHRFAAYLVTQGVIAHSEHEPEGWVVWVRDENQLNDARQALEHFRVAPDDPRYVDVKRTAESILREKQKRREQMGKNVVEMRGRWGRGAAKHAPLVFTLIGLSVLVTLLTNFGNNPYFYELSFCNPAHLPAADAGAGSRADVMVDIRRGEVWRLVTPIFVHMDTLHIVFNMYWLWIFGSQIESRRGTWRLALLVLAAAIIPNVAQAWFSNPMFGGMSGVGYALFGYVWMKSMYDPGSGIFVTRFTAIFFIAWFFLCMTGYVGPVANVAHGLGLIVGVVFGYTPLLFRSSK